METIPFGVESLRSLVENPTTRSNSNPAHPLRARMRRGLSSAAIVAAQLLASQAWAADYHVGPTGAGASTTSTCDSPSAVQPVLAIVAPGDNVIFCDGVYEASIQLQRSGSPGNPITLRAADGAVPIIRGPEGNNETDGIYSAGRVTDIVVDGLWVENWQYAGIGLDFRACSENDPSLAVENITIRNCVVDSNALNGISAYLGTGYLIENNIVSRNGWGEDSWSSNVNLYGVKGDDNVVRGNVAFHGIDTSTNRSDGNGFILDLTLDQGGALFEDNIAFLNGGACISVTDAGGARVIHNSCYHNAKDGASYLDEFNFVDTCRGLVDCIDVGQRSWSFSNFTFENNVAAAEAGKDGLNTNDACSNTNPAVAGEGNELGTGNGGFANPEALDFSRAGAAGSRQAFDPRCVHAASGRVAWWTLAPDLEYIRGLGGIRNCFTPGETTCSAGSTLCGDACVDLGTDESNCGACGTTCGERDTCVNGECLPPAGAFTVDPETGFVSVCDWSGYTWTSAGPEEPGVNATTSTIEETGTLCYAGVVAAHESYNGYAMLGFNLSQPEGEDTPAAVVTPAGEGLNVELTNDTGAILRIQLQDELGGEDENHRWCVEVGGAGGFFPWSQFNTKCWDNSGTAYALEPINVIAVMVAGHNEDDVEFDFCLGSLAPSGTTCEESPSGDDSGGNDSGVDDSGGGDEAGGNDDDGDCDEPCPKGQGCRAGECVDDSEEDDDGDGSDDGDAPGSDSEAGANESGCACSVDHEHGRPLGLVLLCLGVGARFGARRRRRVA